MKWNSLEQTNQFNQLILESEKIPVLVFKHSTRCSISSTALHRVESKWTFNNEEINPYLLNVISNRDISNHLANHFGVKHESPQILLIKNGECIYSSSHLAINVKELAEFVKQ